MRRYMETTPKIPITTTAERPLDGEASRWTTPTIPTLQQDHDQEETYSHHYQKSVLEKVKDKAMKWRHSILNKKHGHDEDTPAWGVSLDDEDDEDQQEDPGNIGASLYESELAPEGYEKAVRQHPRDVPVISDKQIRMSSATHHGEQQDQENSNSKSITETVIEKVSTITTEPTDMSTSKFHGLKISNSAPPGCAEQSCSDDHRWDKGVSVKEYPIQKLEPGEEERALSQFIAEAMDPKKASDDMGMLEKVRDVVASMPWMEESSSFTPMNKPTPISISPNSELPISTNAYEVVEEENEERILQAN